MIVLINTKRNQCYQCSQREAALKIGVTSQTISRWKVRGKEFEQFNHWQIYLQPKKIKQKKGFALK